MTHGSLTHGERIGAFAAALKLSDIPSDVIAKIKLHLLDTVAAAFAFARDPLARQLVSLATRGRPIGRASMIGFPDRTSAREAAFVNGAIGHGKDFDDVHVASITHPSVVVGPAVLAIAEAGQLPGATVIAGTAVGLEVATRLGLAGGAAMARRGIPPMTTCGTLAAAAGAAKTLGLDARSIAAAIGVSGSFASGSHEWTIAGTNSKLTTAGWAARAGVIAAMMARSGFHGSMTAIEGRKGLLVSMAGPAAFDRDEPSAALGDRWEARNLALKRFPTCQGTQPYIAAALELVRRHAIVPADIVAIEVVIGEGVGRTLSEPLEMKRSPPDAYAAKFSIPFCVALAIVERSVRSSHFEEGWGTARRAGELAARITHRVDPKFDIGAADRGLVRVSLADGRVLEMEHRTSRQQLTIADVEAKLDDCAAWALPAVRRRRIVENFLNLEKVDDISTVMALLACHNP